MELYLDSVDFKEIEAAFELGSLTGLTTTPTFMHRSGVTDIDGTILKLSGMVPILQVEALGRTADEIVAEADRLLGIGMPIETTVFKIPVSNEGVKACKRLTDRGIMVNIHLVYTLQQAYMAMIAGATYICPLVGRLQDQGHDALSLVEACVRAVETYGYQSKIMFSSVRHAEHVRNAIEIGVHACTVPWGVMKKLTENNLTTVGTEQFFEHTRLLTMTVSDVLEGRSNPIVANTATIQEALVVMTGAGYGAATVVDANGATVGIFTDGDFRRLIQQQGQASLNQTLNSLNFRSPLTVPSEAVLAQAVELFKKNSVDTLIVTNGEAPVGMLDIQDLIKLNIIS